MLNVHFLQYFIEKLVTNIQLEIQINDIIVVVTFMKLIICIKCWSIVKLLLIRVKEIFILISDYIIHFYFLNPQFCMIYIFPLIYKTDIRYYIDQVFPVIHSLLDAKIKNVLSSCHDETILASVQAIISMYHM